MRCELGLEGQGHHSPVPGPPRRCLDVVWGPGLQVRTVVLCPQSLMLRGLSLLPTAGS